MSELPGKAAEPGGACSQKQVPQQTLPAPDAQASTLSQTLDSFRKKIQGMNQKFTWRNK